MSEPIAQYYQLRARELVDTLFDNKLFDERLTRDNLQSIEDLIAYEYQSFADSNRRTLEILSKLKK